MQRALLLAGVLLGSGLCASAQESPRLQREGEQRVLDARVSRVFDGDTLWVRPVDSGRRIKLRLEGIDAPEICQDGGPAARAALEQRLQQQIVTVHVLRHDDHGRALVRISHAGADVGSLLVRVGHAWSQRWQGDPGPYAALERQARAQRRGVFAQPGAEMPRDFRRRHGPCPLP